MTSKAIDRHVQVTDLVNGGTELMTATAWIIDHAALTRGVLRYVNQHPEAKYEIGGTVDAGSLQLDEPGKRLHLQWRTVERPKDALTAPPID
ncbi:hypothetical protein [Tsukamurella pseudospumae]|uniref:Uncharacterized protein n=1 Tax=Tsukamurella pseudospumae TaxID=239498 RepID=A0A137ZRS1_9ACTN|nr:hypothetical protein [Tsukamurella pseudospumae]KXP00887.1 hypothetical protein AXK61_12830 [Tsukamurella pseudospumae]